MWSDGESPALALERYLARVLRRLGYPVRLHVDAEREHHVTDQLGFQWWGPDYPTPSNFWEPLLSCAADVSYNHGRFCDPSVDTQARRAREDQLLDPARARLRWSEVDHTLTDEAPWVPGPVTRYFLVASPRIGNVQISPVYGSMADRMWVR
jgi:ABC-type transport system substrate-binding protein